MSIHLGLKYGDIGNGLVRLSKKASHMRASPPKKEKNSILLYYTM